MSGETVRVEDWMDKGGIALYGVGVGQVVGDRGHFCPSSVSAG